MPVVNYVKNGFDSIRSLVTSIVADMTSAASGDEFFKVVYPTGVVYNSGDPIFLPKVGGTYPDAKVIILESRVASDPLANIDVSVTTSGSINAAWRIGFVLHNENILTVHAGTRLNLPGKETSPLATPGKLVFLTNRATNPDDLEFREPAGCLNVKPWSNYTNTNNIFGKVPKATIGAAADAQLPGPDYTQPDEVFISRVTSVGAETAYPMNYSLTMTNRGMVLVVWEDNQEEIPEGSLPNTGYGKNANAVDLTKVYGNSPLRWFAIQRAVDRETGRVRGSYAARGGLPFFNTGGAGLILNITVTPPGTAVTAAVITAGGSFYSVNDVVNITGGGGAGAQITVNTVNASGAVLTLTVTAGGVGYATTAGATTALATAINFPNEKSRCPVFCVFGTGVPNSYRKFVVREIDSLVPSPKRPATYNTEDSPAILNPLPQQSVTEQGEFVVTFLNNLSTSRFRYGDEMDLIGTVGAEVAGAGTSISVKVYQDIYTRTYTAMFTNIQYGKGMRIMMLTAANSSDEKTNTGIDYDATIVNNPLY